MIDQLNQLKEEEFVFLTKLKNFEFLTLLERHPFYTKKLDPTGTLCRVKLTKQQLSEWKNYLQN